MIPIKIVGTGLYAPGKPIDNIELKKLAEIEFNHEKIAGKIGIKKRHIARLRGIEETTADFVTHAAQNAIKDAAGVLFIQPKKFQQIIHADVFIARHERFMGASDSKWGNQLTVVSINQWHQRHGLRDIQHTRGVFGAFQKTGHPIKFTCGTTQHKLSSITQVSFVPPP